MRVLCLDCDLGVGEDNFPFGSSVSLFDYDVVFWNPTTTLRAASVFSSTYQGKDSLRDNESARLMTDVKRRRTEFKEFVEMGRCLVVFLPGDTKVFVDSGERTHSGTGRNRQTTRIVREFDLVAAVPVALERSHGSGLEMSPAGATMASLYKQTAEHWTYRCIIGEHKSIRPLLHIKGTTKVVAGLVRTKAGGVIALLPDLDLPFDDPDDVDLDDDSDATDSNSGMPDDDGPQSVGEVADDDGPWPGDLLLSWVESLVAEPDSSLPSWADDYRFPSEITRLAAERDVEEQLAEIQHRLDTLKVEQVQDERWKALVTATGTSLERRVQEALELLGFDLEEGEPGRTDLRGQYGERRVVIEVKGVTKSAAERNAAQLEKWVSEELAEDRSAKGVLIANTWRELPLEARGEADFPDQMLNYTTQRGHCLLTGLQLLAMVRAVIDNPARKREIAKLILDTVGTINGWRDLSAIFAPRESTDDSGESSDVDASEQVEAEDAPADESSALAEPPE